MLLNLSNRYRIRGEEKQYVLEFHRKGKNTRTGEDTQKWDALGYFVTLDSLLRYMMEHRIRISDVTQLSEFIGKIDETVDLITRTLLPPYTIVKKGD